MGNSFTTIIDADKLQNVKFIKNSKEERKNYLLTSINTYLTNASYDLKQASRFMQELKEIEKDE